MLDADVSFAALAHLCGVRSPRDLRRFHARVVQANGLCITLNELYPGVASMRSTGTA